MLGVMLMSSGVVLGDVVAAKTIVAVQGSGDGNLPQADSKYFALRPDSIQVAGSEEGFKLLGTTVLILIFIVAMGAIAITK